MIKKTILKQLIFFVCAVLLLMVPFSGCANKNTKETDKLYYVNQWDTSLTSSNYTITGSDTQEQISNMIRAIKKEKTDSDNNQPLLPKGVQLISYEYDDHQLYLYFNDAYTSEMSLQRELLCRSGIVLSLMQIKDISGISFFVNQMPLTDANGENVGIMTAESFAADLDASAAAESTVINSTVYFSSHDGTALVGEDCTLSTQGSTSLCHKVLDKLMEGPKKKGDLATIPRNTRLNSVSVLNDVCLVDFSREFKDQNTKINEDVLVYSIVDSLTSIPGIKAVQISVNGSTDGAVRYNMPYNRYYTMNSDLIRSE